MKRIWLKENPSDAPAAQQFVVVRNGGEVLTGTAGDIAEDKFNAVHYGDDSYDVAEVWSWTETGPTRMTTRWAEGPPTGEGWATDQLEILDPTGKVVATH